MAEESQKTRVLVIDDCHSIRMTTTTMLQPRYSVIEAEDGETGIALYKENIPDVVFLDIEMPDKNGHEVLKEILAINPAAYVVIISGHATKEHITNSLQGGAKGFIVKPVNKKKLVDYIETYANSKNGEQTTAQAS